MRSPKAHSAAVVALGALLFGAAVVHAGWSYNAHVNVENTKVGLGWDAGFSGLAVALARLAALSPRLPC